MLAYLLLELEPPLVKRFWFSTHRSLRVFMYPYLKDQSTGFYFYRFSFARTAPTFIGRLPAALWVTTARAVAETSGKYLRKIKQIIGFAWAQIQDRSSVSIIGILISSAEQCLATYKILYNIVAANAMAQRCKESSFVGKESRFFTTDFFNASNTLRRF
jgi:hypothetical protein